MKILVAFYSKTGTTKQVAETIFQELEKKGHSLSIHEIVPSKEMKAHEYLKNEKKISLKNPLLDLKKFDLIFLGSPVWNFKPSPIVTTFARQAKHVKGKKFAVFITCSALPGTAIARLSNILYTKSADVVESISINSIFKLDEFKLSKAKKFAEEAVKKSS